MMVKLEPILYIDDEQLNLESFKIQFEEIYQVFTAESAREAYKILEQTEIKVVVSDHRMPEITGIQLLEEVKYKYPDIVRILLTAYVHEDFLMEAINKGGVYRYLTKPWKFIELNAIIVSALEIYNVKLENKQLIEKLKVKVEELQTSEEKFRNIYNSTNEGILIYDFDKKIVNANQSVSRITGYTNEELVGKSIADFIHPDKLDVLEKRTELLIQGAKSIGDMEYKVNTKSGCYIYVQVNSNLISYEGKTLIQVLLHDITEKKFFEKQLYVAQVNAEEKERERFAKELHDGIGPLLSTLKIYMHDITVSSTRESQSTSIAKSGEIINEVISCAKEISNNISPHVLRNFGLIQAIKGFIDKLAIKPEIQFYLKTNLEARITDIIETTLYRITTELINNTLKYANAKNVNININVTENLINFNYTDDGKGFDFDKLQSENKGLGLQNIKSRVYAIGGQLNYLSSPNNGVEVTIVLNASF